MSNQNKHALSKVEGLIPELRFPEFAEDGEWVERTLGELGEFLGGGTPSRTNGEYWLGDIPWISSSDINEDDIHSISISQYINEVAIVESATKIIPKGSILFVSRVGVGKLAVNNEELCTSQDFTSFIPDEILNLFVAYYYSANKNALQSLSQGTSIKGFSKSDLEDSKIVYPNNLQEQQKIASCLSSLDEVIAAHSQKLALLKDHKKGLMQNLFPQAGDTVPKYRFKEFEEDGEWVEKTFDQLFDIGNGRDYKHLEKGEIPVYGSGGYMLSVDEYLYDGESVCIGRKGTIDKPMFLTGKFWTVDTLFYTHSFKDCLPKYIFYVFENINWRNHNEAGGVPSLSKTNIYKIEVLVPPTIDEQQKIASCLSSLDALITAQSEKIEQLQLHKKGLMQGLFPKIEN